MATEETDSDNKVSAKKNLDIVFLLLTAENSNPKSTWHHRDRLFRLQTPRTAAGEPAKSAGKCGQIYGGPFTITIRYYNIIFLIWLFVLYCCRLPPQNPAPGPPGPSPTFHSRFSQHPPA